VTARAIAPETLTRGITYLYRWWVQAELRIVPEAYIRREGDATLVCPAWAIVASATPVSADEVRKLRGDLGRPVFVLCPGLPAGCYGYDVESGESRDLTRELRSVIEILRKHQELLRELGEENPEVDEWWRTRDAGTFEVWASSKAQRLLLAPAGGEVYGYSITGSSEEGYFFYRSKSCRKEGGKTRHGAYKASEHALHSGRKVMNVDLIFSDGKVMLLRLLPTGAGFKAFPRRVPGFEGSLG
jgi:hypothetical protein